MKKTLIIGASTNKERYSYKCMILLEKNEIEYVAIGKKEATIGNINITSSKDIIDNIHTICMYLGAKHQIEYYEYIISLKPKRILFPPGTENEELELLAKNNNIYTEKACPIVMIKTNSY